jgi:hypothetical protein
VAKTQLRGKVTGIVTQYPAGRYVAADAGELYELSLITNQPLVGSGNYQTDVECTAICMERFGMCSCHIAAVVDPVVSRLRRRKEPPTSRNV